MDEIIFRVETKAFAEVALFGPSHPLERLARFEGAESLGYFRSLLDDAPDGSRSAFMDRTAVSAVIAKENPSLDPPPPGASYLVAGQQPGLLTGPLYTFLKAVSILALSRRFARSETLLPLFWVADEDHDILEVNRFHLQGRRFVQPYAGEIRSGAVPQVGEISLHEARQPILDFLEETLSGSGFKPWILEMIGSLDFSNYESAFSGLLRRIFAPWPFRMVRPRALRRLAAPLLASLVERWPAMEEAFGQGSDALHRAGLEPPLRKVGIFELLPGGRVPLQFDKGGVRIGDMRHSFDAAASVIRERPFDFSPNAALRPLLQDGVLPVAATVAGPTELLYLTQLRPLFRAAGIEPSQVIPRISATFVEAKIRRALEKAELDIETVLRPNRELLKMERDSSEKSTEAEEIERQGKVLLALMENQQTRDGARWLDRARRTLAAHLEKITRRLREESLARSGQGRADLEKIEAALAPGGKPQERVVNVLEFLNRHGPSFVRRAVEELDPVCRGHQIVFLENPAPAQGAQRKENP